MVISFPVYGLLRTPFQGERFRSLLPVEIHTASELGGTSREFFTHSSVLGFNSRVLARLRWSRVRDPLDPLPLLFPKGLGFLFVLTIVLYWESSTVYSFTRFILFKPTGFRFSSFSLYDRALSGHRSFGLLSIVLSHILCGFELTGCPVSVPVGRDATD